MSKPLSSVDWRGRLKRVRVDWGGPSIYPASPVPVRAMGVPLNEFGAGLSQRGGVVCRPRHAATRGPAVARPAPARYLRAARPQKTAARGPAVSSGGEPGPSGPPLLLLLLVLAPRLAGPQHRRHRPRQLVGRGHQGELLAVA